MIETPPEIARHVRRPIDLTDKLPQAGMRGIERVQVARQRLAALRR